MSTGTGQDHYPSPLQHLPLACTFLVRPEQRPSEKIPLAVHSVGHYHVGPYWKDNVKTMQFFQLFWGISGRGVIFQEGSPRHLGPGDLATLFPGMEHRVYGTGVAWEYYWMALDGAMAAEVARSMGFELGVEHAGEPPLATFSRLEHFVRDLSESGARWAALTGYEILTVAAQGIRGQNSNATVDEALHLIHEEWNNPDLNVQMVSRRLGENRSTLSKKFHRMQGVTMIEYMMRLRMQNALAELRKTRDSVADIAARCGFGDQAYFAKQVRRFTGCSPLEFRRQ